MAGRLNPIPVRTRADTVIFDSGAPGSCESACLSPLAISIEASVARTDVVKESGEVKFTRTLVGLGSLVLMLTAVPAVVPASAVTAQDWENSKVCFYSQRLPQSAHYAPKRLPPAFVKKARACAAWAKKHNEPVLVGFSYYSSTTWPWAYEVAREMRKAGAQASLYDGSDGVTPSCPEGSLDICVFLERS